MVAPNFFRAGSPFLHHPLLTSERTAAETDFLVTELGLEPGARLLDVGCGFGRHAIALAQRGFAVVGIDSSATMIGAAVERANEAGVQVNFRVVGGEEFRDETRFDAAIALFTTIGQIGVAGDVHTRLVANVFHHLRPEGAFVVEVPQKPVAIANLRATEEFGSDANRTRVVRRYNGATSQVTEHFAVSTGVGERDFTLCYRLFDAGEMASLIEGAGFVLRSCYAGYDRAPLTDESPTMLFVCQKPSATVSTTKGPPTSVVE